MKVLIVDDTPDTRELLELRLRQLGCEVVVCENFACAVKAFHDISIDKVVTDLAMPQHDGYEVAEAIREIDPNAEIAAYTAHPEAINCVSDHINEYFTKGKDEESLMKWVTDTHAKSSGQGGSSDKA